MGRKTVIKCPEGYTEVVEPQQAWEWMDHFGVTGWLAFSSDREWSTPKCLANLIQGMKSGYRHIHHRMAYSCQCAQNRDKIVRCALSTEDGRLFIGEHLPGFCPGMKYRPRRSKKT